MRKIGKLTSGYIPRGSYANPKLVPFEEVLPLKLRNMVSGKGDKSSSGACVQEMSVMFACLKKHDFKQSPCAKEISSFQNCYTTHKEQLAQKQQLEKKGLLVPGEKQLSHKQANLLLKKFPS
ncbi:small ribosomal subunit protein mS37 [Halyomorpha halys]|uniref:small ribosomal subunit protein mS37 n=1 Tax=Halyomorpha halys TaxID=286706 RepID=UPI0006D50650|nr:coiled-coil-helix-coiled-coil-helix domain-containing protein 1 [Halyomorpha halys]